MPDLKPCPFCGNRKPVYRYETVREGNTFFTADYVICPDCGCRTNSYIDSGKRGAMNAWNRRANDADRKDR